MRKQNSLKKVCVRVPGSIGNVGPGFDVLGLAVNLYNTVEMEISTDHKAQGTRHKRKGLEIEIEGEGEDTLPSDKTNIVYQAAKIIFDKFRLAPNALRLTLINHIPLARGLGSSAAARIGGLVAANELCGKKLGQKEILQIATKLEGHPDNVVSALVGGLTISAQEDNEILWFKIRFPQDLKLVACIPEIEISTNQARKILPPKVNLSTVVFNSSRLAMLLAALTSRKYEQLTFALEDKLHQPYRKRLIPGTDDVFAAAKKTGALGVIISGSGPTIVSVIGHRSSVISKVGKAMGKAFAQHNIKSRYLVLNVDHQGAKVIKN